MRKIFLSTLIISAAALFMEVFLYSSLSWSWTVILPLLLVGIYDCCQQQHAILRNFPIVGHARYLLEMVRPEIHQYFVEGETGGVPFNREQRSIVYQRAKKERDTIPFGTKEDLYAVGYEWVNHSLSPLTLGRINERRTIGGAACTLPYPSSLLNISAMSYGSLSKNAILALNEGARLGDFAHNTGEGGISPYHLENQGGLIWQIGTGYFGCRKSTGEFCKEAFRTNAQRESVKMIEIKLSQGAKPGHGGILPAAKVTPQIAEIRGVEVGQDVLSPPGHSAFSTPIGLIEFLSELRKLSGGKPIGFKLCIGKRREFLAICKAMIQTGIAPDFVTIDGGEGGTGAAPLEFSNHIGSPLIDGLIFAHNALTGYGLRKDISVIASGKITTGFDIVKRLALGADLCNSARGMMLALGCIQALKCNSNECPVGVATQNPRLVGGLVPGVKSQRVANYHQETLLSVSEILGSMGIAEPSMLRPWHIMRRVSATETRHYGELFDYLTEGELLEEPLPPAFSRACRAASGETFAHVNET